MKKISLFFFFLILFSFFLSGDEASLNFELSLKEISQMSRGELESLFQTDMILDGVIASISHLDADSETGSPIILVEFMNGEWIGNSEIKTYRCLLRFIGPQWDESFPARPSRNPGPEVLTLNDRLLVYCSLLEISWDKDILLPVLDVKMVRPL